MSGKRLLEFSRRAIRDIAGIEAYIMADNPEAAGKVVTLIFNTSKRLKDHPMMGRAGQSGTRELVLSRYPYTIIYRLFAGKVRIVAVLHHSLKYP